MSSELAIRVEGLGKAYTIRHQHNDHVTLAQVALEDGEFYRPLAAIYKRNKVLSPAMKQFLSVLKDEK